MSMDKLKTTWQWIKMDHLFGFLIATYMGLFLLITSLVDLSESEAYWGSVIVLGIILIVCVRHEEAKEADKELRGRQHKSGRARWVRFTQNGRDFWKLLKQERKARVGFGLIIAIAVINFVINLEDIRLGFVLLLTSPLWIEDVERW